MQLPFAPLEARLARRRGAAPSSAVLREEIDELRGRLRRAAEDRAALDAEVTTLRRALAEADESVVNLTRKTTDEMSAMAERLAAGLRTAVRRRARAGADVGAARDEADRLRARLAEAEARAGAAEQRLEEVGGTRASGAPSWRMRSSGCGSPTASLRARAATPPASRRRRRRPGQHAGARGAR